MYSLPHFPGIEINTVTALEQSSLKKLWEFEVVIIISWKSMENPVTENYTSFAVCIDLNSKKFCKMTKEIFKWENNIPFIDT